MKNLKLLLLVLLIWQLTLTSCKKTEIIKKETGVSDAPSKFTEIKTNADFAWSTTKKIKIEYKPTNNDTRVSVLKVEDSNGHVYLKKLQKTSEKFSGSIEVPIHLKTIKYSIAGIQRELNASAGVLNIEVK
jgi:hypothetical protein